MRLRNALLASAMVVLPVAAGAQPVTGLYIGAAGGWNEVVPRERLRLEHGLGLGTGVAGRGKADFHSGAVGLLNLGWGFGNGLRAEIEGNYRQNDISKLRGFGASPFTTHGFQRSYGVMANVLYDFDFANFGLGPSIVQPYLGGGVGYVWDDWHRVRGTSLPTGNSLLIDGVQGRFAYQGIAGVAFPLTQFGITGLSLTAEYRFLGTLDPRINARVVSPVGTTLSSGRVRTENLNHSVLIGLRYALFQPPPPPPPMAAPAPAPAPAAQPARTYLVFFDWDRADLTARAREIIGEAAQNSRRMQVTRIEVAGHADRSGDAAYNQRLSQRRADAVAAELVRDGVSRNEITVQAFGESRPLVPTADGVREPQNRRVEIVLR